MIKLKDLIIEAGVNAEHSARRARQMKYADRLIKAVDKFMDKELKSAKSLDKKYPGHYEDIKHTYGIDAKIAKKAAQNLKSGRVELAKTKFNKMTTPVRDGIPDIIWDYVVDYNEINYRSP